MKYAWIENEKIRDICPVQDPYSCYTTEIAAFYTTQVPDTAENGDGWVNGQVVPKPIPAPTPEPEPAPRTWNSNDVRNGLTLAEKAKWDSNVTPEIATAKLEFQAAKNLADTTEVLNFLVSSASISQASMDKILA
jgi:hypothetical protein